MGKGFAVSVIAVIALGAVQSFAQRAPGAASRAATTRAESLPSAGAPASAPAATDQRIAQAIRDLGADKYETRDEANKFLMSAGAPAWPALRRAAASADPEIAVRARNILDQFKWRTLPDTPADVVKEITAYRSCEEEAKPQKAVDLYKSGKTGLLALKIILQAEDQKITPALVAALIQNCKELQIDAQAVRKMIAAGQLDQAEESLEARAFLGLEFPRDYVAFLVSSGKLDRKIEELSRNRQADDRVLLALMHRAKGELDIAVDLSAQSPELYRQLLCEAGRWKEAAEAIASDPPPPPQPDQGIPDDRAKWLGRQMVCNRMAGQDEAFTRNMNDLLKTLNTDRNNKTVISMQLLLNDRIEQGLDLDIQVEGPSDAFDVFVEHGDFVRALGLCEQPGAPANPDVQVKGIKLLHQLGAGDKAVKKLQSLAEDWAKEKQSEHYMLAAGCYKEWGMTKEFDEAILLALDRWKMEDSAILRLALGRDPLHHWWTTVEQIYPKRSLKDRLEILRQLLDGKLPLSEVQALLPDVMKVQPTQWYDVMTVLLLYKDFPDLKSYIERWRNDDKTSMAEQVIAEHWEKEGKWSEAADMYQAALAKDPRPLWALLQGFAREKAGQKDLAQRLLKTADMMALADSYRRAELAEALESHGRGELAERQWDILSRTGAPEDIAYITAAINNVNWMLMAKGQYARARNLAELARISLMNSNGFLAGLQGYTYVLYRSHLAGAKLAAKDRDWDKYAAEIAFCQKAFPCAWDIATEAVGELDKAGKAKLADGIFRTTWTANGNICRDWPGNAYYANGTAWFAARCRRELGPAEELARKAVALDPKNAGLLDTLAEVLFQKGQRDQAVELCKKSLVLEAAAKEPKLSNYLRAQLKRFQTGDKSSPPPPQ